MSEFRQIRFKPNRYRFKWTALKLICLGAASCCLASYSSYLFFSKGKAPSWTPEAIPSYTVTHCSRSVFPWPAHLNTEPPGSTRFVSEVQKLKGTQLSDQSRRFFRLRGGTGAQQSARIIPPVQIDASIVSSLEGSASYLDTAYGELIEFVVTDFSGSAPPVGQQLSFHESSIPRTEMLHAEPFQPGQWGQSQHFNTSRAPFSNQSRLPSTQLSPEVSPAQLSTQGVRPIRATEIPGFNGSAGSIRSGSAASPTLSSPVEPGGTGEVGNLRDFRPLVPPALASGAPAVAGQIGNQGSLRAQPIHTSGSDRSPLIQNRGPLSPISPNPSSGPGQTLHQASPVNEPTGNGLHNGNNTLPGNANSGGAIPDPDLNSPFVPSIPEITPSIAVAGAAAGSSATPPAVTARGLPSSSDLLPGTPNPNSLPSSTSTPQQSITDFPTESQDRGSLPPVPPSSPAEGYQDLAHPDDPTGGRLGNENDSFPEDPRPGSGMANPGLNTPLPPIPPVIVPPVAGAGGAAVGAPVPIPTVNAPGLPPVPGSILNSPNPNQGGSSIPMPSESHPEQPSALQDRGHLPPIPPTGPEVISPDTSLSEAPPGESPGNENGDLPERGEAEGTVPGFNENPPPVSMLPAVVPPIAGGGGGAVGGAAPVVPGGVPNTPSVTDSTPDFPDSGQQINFDPPTTDSPPETGTNNPSPSDGFADGTAPQGGRSSSTNSTPSTGWTPGLPPVVPILGGAAAGGAAGGGVPGVIPPTPPLSSPSYEGPFEEESDSKDEDLPRICTPWIIQNGQTVDSLAASIGTTPAVIREINATASFAPGEVIRLPVSVTIPCCD